MGSAIFERELSLLSRAPCSHWLTGEQYGDKKQVSSLWSEQEARKGALEPAWGTQPWGTQPGGT